jgi:hypothetical protein
MVKVVRNRGRRRRLAMEPIPKTPIPHPSLESPIPYISPIPGNPIPGAQALQAQLQLRAMEAAKAAAEADLGQALAAVQADLLLRDQQVPRPSSPSTHPPTRPPIPPPTHPSRVRVLRGPLNLTLPPPLYLASPGAAGCTVIPWPLLPPAAGEGGATAS